MLKEFREFALKGNVVDLAVGIIIGAAFGAIVNSLVADIIMPMVGLVSGGIDFSQRFLLLKEGLTTPGPYASVAAAKEAGAVTVNIGLFINLIINFVIVAFALFLVVKAMNAARRDQAATPPPPALPSKEEILLTEIRDLLQQRRP